MKVFLSHSSADKVLVDAVAKRLTRAKVWYDVMHISAADDLKKALEKGLEDSDLFVLFASTKALASDWVNFEITVAEREKYIGKMNKICAFIIDSKVKVTQLPPIFQSTHISHQDSANIISQEIIRIAQDMRQLEQHSLFVGRAEQLSSLSRAFEDIESDTAPVAVHLYGLEGMGRRSLAQHFARNTLGLDTSIEIEVASGDSQPEIIIEMESHLSIQNSEEEIASRLEDLRNWKTPRLDERLFELMCILEDNSCATFFHDRGGLLDEEANLMAWAAKTLEIVSAHGRPPFFFIGRRRPVQDWSTSGPRLPSIRVPDLNDDDSRTLVSALFRKRKLRPSPGQIKELGLITHGYPPAAYYIAELAAEDGIDMVLANPALVTKVTEARFLRILENDEHLTKHRRGIISLLANYDPLPLSIISDFLRLNPEEIHGEMTYLLDTSLIFPARGSYKISGPIKRAAARIYPINTIDHEAVGQLVSTYLDELEGEIADDMLLDLMRCYSRAYQFSSKTPTRINTIRFPSDQIELAQKLYYAQEYEAARKAAEEALGFFPALNQLRQTYIRALIQTENYDLALEQIEQLENSGSARDAAFLNGFLCRKRRGHEDAIAHFNRSIELGKRGIAIHRELAQCYLELGELGLALRHIKVAEADDPDNVFVVDLKCQIAIRQNNEEEARRALDVLQVIDRKEYYLHRKSIFELKFGRPDAAMIAANEAYKINPKPSFHIAAQRVNAMITCGDSREATLALAELDSRFQGKKKDIRIGLRCKLLSAQSKFRDALLVWNGLTQRNLPVHRYLKLQILNGLLESGVATQDNIRELRKLEQQLDFQVDSWDLFEF